MKKFFTLLYILIAFFSKADYWTQKANFTGAGRALGFSFSIGNKGYIGYGAPLSASNNFWEYDPLTDVWTQKADIGNILRVYGLGFSISTLGYAGLGVNPGSLNDWWEYNPIANVWIQKALFPGLPFSASGFAIGSNGYVCFGGDEFGTPGNSFWKFDPLLNSWTQKSNLIASPRTAAIAFTISNKAYTGTGGNLTTNFQDFWEYDVITDAWTQKANVPGNTRISSIAFAIAGCGYVGLGANNGVWLNDFWQYQPLLNTWIQKTSFPAAGRTNAAYFSVGSKGYVGFGTQNLPAVFNDVWEYTPDSTTGIPTITTTENYPISISPNPASQYAVISIQPIENKNVEILITTLDGKKVFSKQVENKTSNHTLQTSNFPKGIYLVQVISNAKVLGTKKLMVE